MRAGTTWLLLALAEGCGFSPTLQTGDGSVSDSPTDVVPDVPPQPPIPRWVVAGTTTTTSSLVIHPLMNVFGNPCPNQTAPSFAYRSFLTRAGVPYIYGVESQFWGLGLGCAAVTKTMVSGGGPREIQRIALDPNGAVGFFTADGPLATGVYRFTATPDGTPTAGGTANGPSAAGALAFDAANSALYIAGSGIVYQYTLLNGAAFDFPATGSQVTAAMCTQPIDMLVSGDSILGFCADSPNIRHYVRSPFAYDGDVGAVGAVNQVIAMPGDRAIAATVSPATLVVIHMHAGAPTLDTPVTVASAVTAMAISEDGKVLVTARQSDATHSELTAWSINGDSLTKIDSDTQNGTVTALAITTPGT